MSTDEVAKLMKKNGITMKEFDEWMFGQTVGINEDGTINYYEHDVMRFIELKVNGTPTYFD